jgi:cephalosporin-C deacetylase-like acetyl esterase/lysophospholipase L1-like esterase
MTLLRSCRPAALVAAWILVAPAAPAQQPVELKLTPYHADGIYAVKETVGWTLHLPQDVAVPAGPCTFTIKKNNFDPPIKTGTLEMKENAVIETSLDEPGMIFVQVTPPAGGISKGSPRGIVLGAAVAPTKIAPSTPKPADFDAFWDGKIKALKDVPVNVELTPGDSGRPGIEFATFAMDSLGSKVHGYLAKPTKEGKLPAVVILQWAGVYALPKNAAIDRAREGWLAVNVDAHDKDPAAAPATLNNYAGRGTTDREKAYFLNMYLRDYRVIDYVTSRPDWDGKTLLLLGTSMGGQQSLCLAGLHPQVTHLIVNVPAGCDFSAALHGRQAGYPNWPTNDPKVVETGQYFDAVNFAPKIKATSLVAMGFVDTSCPPAGIWAAFNQISGPKEAVPMPESPHNHLATATQQRPFTTQSAEWLKALAAGEPVTLKPLGDHGAMPTFKPVPRADANSKTAHEQLLAKAKTGKIDVYFTGDSITRRWGATDYPQFLENWNQNFHGWNAANFGWGADSVQNVLWRLQNGELDGVNPKVIVVMAGTNNLGGRGGGEAKIAEVTEGLKAVHATCKEKAPKATVILMGLTPRNDNPALIQSINTNLEKLADGKQVRYLNINDKLADKDGKFLDGMSPDRLHLSAKGYQVWADALKPILTELLGPPAAKDLAPPPTGDPSAKKK